MTKNFSTNFNRKRHENNCKSKIDNEKIKELEKQIEKLKGVQKESANINITNNTNNTNNTFNIVIVPYKSPDVSHLTDRDYYHSISKSIMAVPLLIEKIHFNPKKPENHNVYISNFKNKYAMVHDGEEWSMEEEDDVIDDLIQKNELRISEWSPKNPKKYPNIDKTKKQYEKVQYSDNAPKTIKKEIKKMLYNNRNKIKHIN